MQDLYHYIQKTPILTNENLDNKFGCKLFFKCENLQVTGSFKYRGACNSILSLTDKQKQNGVITVSSGNHGAAIAKAAKLLGVKAYIIVPENSSPVKITNIKCHGAQILYCGNNPQDRFVKLEAEQQKTKAHFISPYNDMDVIKGQATVTKEILTEIADLDAIIAPIGGGGLVSGTILARDEINPNVDIYAAEPEGANDAYLSLKSNDRVTLDQTNTICDGLRSALGDITYPIIKEGIKDIITVSDEETIAAMRLIWENLKIIIEPSSATSLASLINRIETFQNKKIGLILTGGNVILDRLLWPHH